MYKSKDIDIKVHDIYDMKNGATCLHATFEGKDNINYNFWIDIKDGKCISVDISDPYVKNDVNNFLNKVKNCDKIIIEE